MNEHPIIFSGSMVRAILDGRKSMTRRVIKPQPHPCAPARIDCHELESSGYGYFDEETDYKCPYGAPIDLLWARETWRVGAWDVGKGIAVDYKADGYARREYLSEWVPDLGQRARLIGQSQEDAIKAGLPDFKWEPGQSPCRWRPSIHMPRWASRITLKVTDIRVERVQEINGRDVLAEGVDNGMSNPAMGIRWENMQRAAFRELWNSINAARGFCWISNPWVWVISFERVTV